MRPYTFSAEDQAQIVKYLQSGAKKWSNIHPQSLAAPWENEPVEPQTGTSPEGLPWCLMRGPRGAWNGYVGVPPGHPAFKFSELVEERAEVHGGVTYGYLATANKDPNEFFWFGFDCAHGYDIAPGTYSPIIPSAEYRTLEFALAETLSLAKQLHEFKPPTSAELLQRLRDAEPTLVEQYLMALEAEAQARRCAP